MRTRNFASVLLAAGLAGGSLFVLLVLAGPARGAEGDQGSAIPCGQVADAIKAATGSARTGQAIAAIDRDCRPLPSVVVSAIRTGKWEDGVALTAPDRATLLAQATSKKYPEAETLAVKLIETGLWPDSSALSPETGTIVIRSLKSNLTTYRAHLLLDIYEQLQDPNVRMSIIQTLRSSKLPEALLPALEAAYDATGALKEAGMETISAQPEKTPAGVHAVLLKRLPAGATLTWALRLAKEHPSDPVKKAIDARHLKN